MFYNWDFLFTIPSSSSLSPSLSLSFLPFFLPELKSVTNCSSLMDPLELGLTEKSSFWDPLRGYGQIDLQSLTDLLPTAFLAKALHLYAKMVPKPGPPRTGDSAQELSFY